MKIHGSDLYDKDYKAFSHHYDETLLVNPDRVYTIYYLPLDEAFTVRGATRVININSLDSDIARLYPPNVYLVNPNWFAPSCYNSVVEMEEGRAQSVTAEELKRMMEETIQVEPWIKRDSQPGYHIGKQFASDKSLYDAIARVDNRDEVNTIVDFRKDTNLSIPVNAITYAAISGRYLDILLNGPVSRVPSIAAERVVESNNLDYLHLILSHPKFDVNYGWLDASLVRLAVTERNADALRMVLSDLDVYVPDDLSSNDEVINSLLEEYRSRLDALKVKCGIDPITLDEIPFNKRIAWLESGSVQCFDKDELGRWLASDKRATNPLTRRRVPKRVRLELTRPLVIHTTTGNLYTLFYKASPVGFVLAGIWKGIGVTPDTVSDYLIMADGKVLTHMNPRDTFPDVESVTVTKVVPDSLREWGRDNGLEWL